MFTTKILIKKMDPSVTLPKIIKKGEWIDLYSRGEFHLHAPQSGTLKSSKEEGTKFRDVTFDSQLIPLGVAMQLPKGIEAHILPRSSTFKSFGIIQANSQGIVDSSYCGDTDEWKYPAIALRHTTIEDGSKICQFRIQLSQKATVWQKLKWLFTGKIKFVEVDHLNNKARGGFGTTGTK